MKENRLGKLKADDGSVIEYFIGDRESLKRTCRDRSYKFIERNLLRNRR